jgi:hypothetical protein
MSSVWNILYRTLVVEYYRQNVGFLFLIAMFAFGILRPEDHVALSAYVFDSPLLLSLLFAIWGLYHLKLVGFVRQRLGWEEYEILYQLVLIPKWTRWLLLFAMQFMLWLPIVGYAVFVAYRGGWQEGQYEAVFGTAVFVGVLPLTGVWAYEYRLARPNPDSKLGKVATYFNRRFSKPLVSYFLLYVFKKEPMLLLLTKLFTVGVLVGVCRLYPTDDYDERLLSLGALVAGLGHATMLLHLYEFEHLQMPFLRNLPLPLIRRMGHYIALFCLLLLPESVLLLRNLPDGVGYGYALQNGLLMLSLLGLIFSRFLQTHALMEDLLRQGFYVFVVFFFLIMFRVPPWALAAVVAAVSVGLFFRFYYRSEYLYKETIRPE